MAAIDSAYQYYLSTYGNSTVSRYDTTKDKKAHPDRMETKKYCRFCKTHTLHKETK